MKKKLLSLLVVICVVFSILPQTTSISSNNLLLNSTNPNSNDAFSLVSSNERSATTYGATATNGVTVSQKSDYPMSGGYGMSGYIDTNTGYLYAVGTNSYANFGNGTNTGTITTYTAINMSNDASKPFVNPVDWDFSSDNVSIIDANGKLWISGSNDNGGLGNGTFGIKEGAPGNTYQQWSFEMVESIGGNTNYKAIKTDGYTWSAVGKVVMLEDGSLWGAGRGTYMGFTSAEAMALGGVSRSGSDSAGYTAGAPGSGNYFVDFTRLDTKLPEDDNKIKDFKFGSNVLAILTTKGNLYTVGSNTSYMGGASSYTTPKLTNVAQISAQYGTMALLNDGTLWVVGRNTYGQLGLGLNNADGTAVADVSVFTQVDTSFLASGEFIIQVESMNINSGLLTNKGNLYLAGTKAYMGIGHTDASGNPATNPQNYYTTFTKCHEGIKWFALNHGNVYLLYDDGKIEGVGNGSYGGNGSGTSGSVDAGSDNATLNPPATEEGGGITGGVTLPPFTPNPESYPQDEYDKLPEEEKEDLTTPTEPDAPGTSEGGSGTGFEGEDGKTYNFTPPA